MPHGGWLMKGLTSMTGGNRLLGASTITAYSLLIKYSSVSGVVVACIPSIITRPFHISET